jgi:Glycine zipper 2TM domain
MMRSLGAGLFASSLLALATMMPSQPAAAQDPVGGAIVGGALGGILGGALGHGRGAVAGAIAGATAGAVIASEARPRPGGYYWWRGNCYYRYPDGAWSQPLYPSYCGY